MIKEIFGNLKSIIIAVLIIIIILQQQCSSPFQPFNLNPFNKRIEQPVEGMVITKIETKWDTVKIDSLVYIPKWKTKIETIHDTIPANIDTLDILKDYYTKYFYTDTLDLDSLGNIIIKDTISRNSIVFRQITPNLLLPTTTITRDSLISKHEFYVGIGLAGNRTQFNYIGGELLFRSKRKKVYGIGLGLNQTLEPVISARMMWKLGKK
jgi:hypothetical protein|tara:strand:+ start:2849 stop:3475 length:627 start_codon:yes stop_codon:yes gene_type:complete